MFTFATWPSLAATGTCETRSEACEGCRVIRARVKVCSLKEWCSLDAISKFGAVWDVFALQSFRLFARQPPACCLQLRTGEASTTSNKQPRLQEACDRTLQVIMNCDQWEEKIHTSQLYLRHLRIILRQHLAVIPPLHPRRASKHLAPIKRRVIERAMKSLHRTRTRRLVHALRRRDVPTNSKKRQPLARAATLCAASRGPTSGAYTRLRRRSHGRHGLAGACPFGTRCELAVLRCVLLGCGGAGCA